MSSKEKPDIGKLFAERKPIEDALNRALRAAIIQHQQAGLPMAVWRDGKTVWVDPNDFIEDGEDDQ